MILTVVQRDATQNNLFIILQVPSTCFGCQPHPSSGVHKTVTTASGTGHIFCAATSLQHGQAWPRWREVASLWTVININTGKMSSEPHMLHKHVRGTLNCLH